MPTNANVAPKKDHHHENAGASSGSGSANASGTSTNKRTAKQIKAEQKRAAMAFSNPLNDGSLLFTCDMCGRKFAYVLSTQLEYKLPKTLYDIENVNF